MGLSGDLNIITRWSLPPTQLCSTLYRIWRLHSVIWFSTDIPHPSLPSAPSPPHPPLRPQPPRQPVKCSQLASDAAILNIACSWKHFFMKICLLHPLDCCKPPVSTNKMTDSALLLLTDDAEQQNVGCFAFLGWSDSGSTWRNSKETWSTIEFLSTFFLPNVRSL